MNASDKMLAFLNKLVETDANAVNNLMVNHRVDGVALERANPNLVLREDGTLSALGLINGFLAEGESDPEKHYIAAVYDSPAKEAMLIGFEPWIDPAESRPETLGPPPKVRQSDTSHRAFVKSLACRLCRDLNSSPNLKARVVEAEDIIVDVRGPDVHIIQSCLSGAAPLEVREIPGGYALRLPITSTVQWFLRHWIGALVESAGTKPIRQLVHGLCDIGFRAQLWDGLGYVYIDMDLDNERDEACYQILQNSLGRNPDEVYSADMAGRVGTIFIGDRKTVRSSWTRMAGLLALQECDKHFFPE